MKELIEGDDYYINNDGYLVMTEKYHRERGYCCGNGCLHCPYSFEAVPEPRRSELLGKRGTDVGVETKQKGNSRS
jgi:Family of unknown function (DUF5522)